MKNLALFLLAIGLGYQAIAATDPFLLLVEKNLNGLFSDTINNGEPTARVLRINDQPQIKCSKLIYSKGRKIVICTAAIETGYGPEQNSQGQTTCTSLGFILDKKGQIESRYNPESIQKCLEKISNSSYE